MDNNDTSFLFAGTCFNRKKFARDFDRFKVKKKSDAEIIESHFNDNCGNEEEDDKVVVVSSKKRKRKGAVLEPIEGFNVFKSSRKLEAVVEQNDATKDEVSQQKKKFNQQIEQSNLARKQYNLHVKGEHVPAPLKNFGELRSGYKCEEYILSNLAELGFKEPTPIQRQAIPILLSGRECFACAPTGSGKTFAFVCPMLMKLKESSTDGIRGIIICPTRELAAQTTRECKKLAKGKKFYIKLMTKELATSCDFSKKLHCDILVSTPFRLKYAVRKRKLNLSRVEFLVLDESDKLFELGLVHQIDFVVKACSNPSIVRSLFSATLPDFVEDLAGSIMHDAVRVIVGRKNTASELVDQKLVYTGTEEGKLIAIRQSFSKSLNPPVLVFVQSKERAKELYEELESADVRVDVIHSDLSQAKRENAVDDFRAGKTWVLIATDVIARGMDFKGVNSVINYDFPDSASAYIHRIGRSGRAGRKGEAITFYTEADVPYLRNIANVMTASGCEVPSWILDLSKKKWKKHRPTRARISTIPDENADGEDDEEQEQKEDGQLSWSQG